MNKLRPSRDIQTLLKIMELLRSPQGCPWDREQTSSSLVPYTLEEAYEVADAIATGDGYKICEELGDLLLQIVFLSQIAQEQGQFSFEDVALAITGKLLRRHPHIFAQASAETPEDVSKLWAEVKAEERGGNPPKAPPLPGLILAEKLSGKIDLDSVEDPLIQQMLALAKQAKAEGRCLEAEIHRFCVKFWP